MVSRLIPIHARCLFKYHSQRMTQGLKQRSISMGNCSAKDGSLSCSATGVGFEGGGRGVVESPKRVRDIMKGGARGGHSGRGERWEEEGGFKKLEVLQSPEKGVWRVRVAIKSEQWAEILKEQANTEAMIERMRRYVAQQQ